MIIRAFALSLISLANARKPSCPLCPRKQGNYVWGCTAILNPLIGENMYHNCTGTQGHANSMQQSTLREADSRLRCGKSPSLFLLDQTVHYRLLSQFNPIQILTRYFNIILSLPGLPKGLIPVFRSTYPDSPILLHPVYSIALIT